MPAAANARIALSLARINGGLTALESRAALRKQLRRLGGPRPPGAQPAADPLGFDVLADPYAWYRELHAGPRVHHNQRRDVWILSRHADVRAAAQAHAELSSAEGVTRLRHRLPTLLTIDRPDHTRLRRLVARDFTRDAVAARRPEIERLAGEAVAAMCEAERVEVVERLASPLPVVVIAHLLGVPPSDLGDFRRWSDRIVEGFTIGAEGAMLGSSVRVLGSVVRLHAYLHEQFARLRRSPGDDVLSRLLASSEEGRLTETELFWFALVLLVAGNETTTSLLGSMLLALAENPGVYERLRGRPDLAPAAVEEALRCHSPIQAMYRTARVDYGVGDVTIPARSRVLLLFGAANRDPARYPDPDRFVLDRGAPDHLAFGSGIHFCLGAHLARLEATVVLRELVSRVRTIELADRPRWTANPTVRVLSRLHLRLEPA